MITKKTINQWIKTIDNLRNNLHTGAGAMISGTYSKENSELYAAATALRDLLTIYYNFDSLSKEQLKRIATLTESVRLKSALYESAKENMKKSPYSLTGNPRKGVAVATGDKRTRLKASEELRLLCLFKINKAIATEQDFAPDSINNLPPEYAKIEEKLGEPDASYDELSYNLYTFATSNKSKMDALELRINAINARNEYHKTIKNNPRGQTTTLGALKKKFMVINDLHRIALLSYNNNDEFLKCYRDYRYKIKEVVDIYNWALKKKNGDANDREIYRDFRTILGLTKKQFLNLEEKVSTLEMIGRHMDAQIGICASPEFTKMSMDDLKNLTQMSKDNLKSYIKSHRDNIKNPNMPDELKPGKELFGLLKNAYELKKLQQLGITKKTQPEHRIEASHISRTVKRGKMTRKFKFLNIQSRYGRKDVKAQLVNGDFDMPGLLKAKLGKYSAKYKSEHGHVEIGGHAGVGGVLTAGSVGLGFSLKHPLDTKVSLVGAAEAYAVRGVGKAVFGDSNMNLAVKLSGHVAHAKASGGVSLGHVTITDNKGKVEADGFGISVKGGATAAVLNGSLYTGFSVFGIRISFEAQGKAIAAGLEGEATFVANSGLKIGVGGALGLGGGIYLSVDWRSLYQRYKRYKERKAISNSSHKAKELEKAKNKKKPDKTNNKKESKTIRK